MKPCVQWVPIYKSVVTVPSEYFSFFSSLQRRAELARPPRGPCSGPPELGNGRREQVAAITAASEVGSPPPALPLAVRQERVVVTAASKVGPPPPALPLAVRQERAVVTAASEVGPPP